MRILIVEDERKVAAFLSRGLSEQETKWLLLARLEAEARKKAAAPENPYWQDAGTTQFETPLRLSAELDRVRLVLTDVYAPGWIAEVDGTPTPVIAVDGAFRGVSVDEGTAQVVFRYVPLFTYAGFIVAAAAIVVTLALAWALRRRDR